MERNYTLAVSAATLLLAEELADMEKNEKRKDKKNNVLERKRAALSQAFPEETANLSPEDNARELLAGDWPEAEAKTLIIDLAFSNPFAPYELDFKARDLWTAIGKVGFLIGLGADEIDQIQETQREAFRVHRQIAWGKIALFGIGGLVVMGATGWFLAPIIGGAIGAAAGLSGAAATSHGLAILGGGSLAIGGMGMSGGMWVVTGTAATLGILGGGGSTLLLQIGAASAKIELMKLQVNYKEVILGTQMEVKKAQEIIKNLTQQRAEIEEKLEEERQLNEKNSKRIKDIEATLEALEDAIEWMKTVRSQDDKSVPQPARGERTKNAREDAA